MWLSLVEHLVRDEGVAGSNPATPTRPLLWPPISRKSRPNNAKAHRFRIVRTAPVRGETCAADGQGLAQARAAGFACLAERTGVEAKLGFEAHPDMLRHACDYALANKGHDTRPLQAYLEYRNIQHTAR